MTVTLGFLFALVIAAGVLTLIQGLKNPMAVQGEQTCLDNLKKAYEQNKWVGGSLIGVGVLGIVMVMYMSYTGNEGVTSNFGFKFY